MIDGETRTLDKFATPFGKDVEVIEVVAENGVRLLRLRIREGSRFTILELDPVTARRWGEKMTDWAKNKTNYNVAD